MVRRLMIAALAVLTVVRVDAGVTHGMASYTAVADLKVEEDGAAAENADSLAGVYLNTSDWFSLRRLAEERRDELSPFMSCFSDALLCSWLNRPEQACAAIERLLSEFGVYINNANRVSMTMLLAMNLEKSGRCAEAAAVVADIMGAGEDVVPADYVAELQRMEARFKELARYDLYERTGRAEAEIPFRVAEIGEAGARMIEVDGRLNGRSIGCIFDTGAGSTFMSEAFAKKAGVRQLTDSLPIHGGTTVYGQAGILDSMQIGDIMVKNIPVMINSDTTLNRVEDIDFLIGADIMRLLGEIQIFPHRGKIVIPTKRSEKPASGSNMYMDNRTLILRGESGGKSYNFLFDTGNGLAALSHSFYENNKTGIDAKGKRVRRLTGGIGLVAERDMLMLPEWSFQFGGKNVVFRDICVTFESNSHTPYAGNIGMALVNQFNKVTINFKECFVTFE